MEKQYSQEVGQPSGPPAKNKRNQLFIAIGIAFVFAIAAYGLWQFFVSQPVETVEEEVPAPVQKDKQQEWTCGDNVTFTYRGSEVTYGIVSSQGECWMDRNLGASAVATAYNDADAYGDLFQWGREDDGHQVRSPAPNTVEGDVTLTVQPGHGDFIMPYDHAWMPYDWADNTWETRWTVAASDPCPDGWRVPTDTELDTERASWSSQDYNGAFASPLKLTAAGYRYYVNGSLYNVGSHGIYWSSTVSDTDARWLTFLSIDANMFSNTRAYGVSLRCVQDR